MKVWILNISDEFNTNLSVYNSSALANLNMRKAVQELINDNGGLENQVIDVVLEENHATVTILDSTTTYNICSFDLIEK